ncbi:MAG TPA: amidohydrolase family protein, partial [Dehalococcoidia bacterium]|nr:amidohydrolase family protein [Dehalococcoidia bacterium]
MIVDFHAHIVSPRIKGKRELYVARDPYFRMLYSGKDRLATAEDLVASMDEAGVDVSVALNLPWQDMRLMQETNDYILEAMARYPARIVGFGVLPPGEGAFREMERLVQGGVKGLGELSTGPGFGLEDLKVLASLVRK